MSGTSQTVIQNIQAIVELEEQARRHRRISDKVADAIATFVGQVRFVALHLGLFIVWAAVNAGILPFIPAFDPFPFPLLTMIVSLEGVLMSTFVLIKQNRMSEMADRRAHLDLQVNLLTEKEVTKVIQMLERISGHLGVADAADRETAELGQKTAVGELARELDEAVPKD